VSGSARPGHLSVDRLFGSRVTFDGFVTTCIIVLNWNGLPWLQRCLPALAAQSPAPTEIRLVDNASTDGSVEWVRLHHPNVRVIALEQNVGFAAGNNRGAAGATADALVFLNNDTEVECGWLAALVEAARQPRSPAMVTSRIVYWDRPDVVDSAGDGYLRCGGGFKVHHGQPAATAPGSREVFGACGAAFLIRREWFERLGGFDESFFMVYEDVDLAYRARLQGATIWYAADAVVKHGGSASMGRVSDLSVECGQRNLELVWLVNSPQEVLWRSLPSHLAYTLLAAMAFFWQGRFGAWWRGKRDVWRLRGEIRARRRAVQHTLTVDWRDLWRLMEPRWIATKRREKRFDFNPD
jgi:GT2 family glycosyltransferase